MLEVLRRYRPGPEEIAHHKAIIALIEESPDCFYRTHFNPGHITGSGLLMSADGNRVLMNHHKFLDMWICFGGHADGERDVLNVALREVIEESGITSIAPVTGDIFDVDVHAIPPNPKKGEPAHKHFDIRYLFRVTAADDEVFAQSEESNNLRWCGFEEAGALAAPQDLSMHRLLRKWRDENAADIRRRKKG